MLVTLVVGLLAMAGGAAAQGQPPPVPLPPGHGCEPGSPLPGCHLPPEVHPPPVVPSPPPGGGDGDSGGGGGNWITDQLTDWIEGFFSGLVRSALNPMLDALGGSLLATPELHEMRSMVELWTQSRHIVFVVYALVVLVAGLVVMAYQTLQTEYSWREILPRLIVGFLAACLSLPIAGHAITLANALSRAVLGPGLDPQTAGRSMAETFMNQWEPGGLYLILLGLALAVMVLLVLLTYVVRVMLTVVLLAGAPLFLMCHALPHTEGIAFWWWKAFAGVLVIQLGQSLALIAALKLFFSPGGITLFD